MPSPPSELARPPSNAIRIAALVLLALGAGVATAMLAHGADRAAVSGWRRLWDFRWEPLCVVVAAGVAAIAWVKRPVATFVERLRQVSPKTRRLVTVGVWAAATLYMICTSLLQKRDLFPQWHDEFSYLLGAQIMAHGRLWMAEHPCADFFQSFHILVKPVYCSMYPPGTALLYAGTAKLSLPPWILAMTISGAVVGMTYRVVSELVDGAAGVMAALLLLALGNFRYIGAMTMSHVPMALGGLLMIWAFLHWRRERRMGWALVLGMLGGWAAITRPVDAVCFAAPIGVAMLFDGRGLGWRRWMATGAVLFVGAAPFLSLQLLLDHGSTGRWLYTPEQMYFAKYFPLEFGINVRVDRDFHPPTSLQQFEDFNKYFLIPEAQKQADHGLMYRAVVLEAGTLIQISLASYLLVIPILVGLLGLRDRRRLTALAVLPLFVAAYLILAGPFGMALQYCLIVTPLVLLAVFLGMRVLRDVFPLRQRYLDALLALAVFVIAGSRLAAGGLFAGHEVGASPALREINTQLAALPDQRAVVLFKYVKDRKDGRYNFHDEPVYNIESAWPDDQRIIRAQDLGPERDKEIFRYYAQRQRDRVFYSYNRQTMKLERLGTAAELAE